MSHCLLLIASGGQHPERSSRWRRVNGRCRRKSSKPILSRTEGVPLFVEELTKAVLEIGDLEDDGGKGTRAAGPFRRWPFRRRWKTR